MEKNYVFTQTPEEIQGILNQVPTIGQQVEGLQQNFETLNETVGNLGESVTQLQETKVEKVEGKQLSTEDFTSEDKAKLQALPTNAELQSEYASQQEVGGIDERLEVVEQLGQISVSGGSIGIATPSDFDNPTPEQAAKVPTVGAILGCMDEVPTPNSVKPVQSGGVLKDMFLMEFVGRGGTFVENQDTCINWIKGHTYRVYPYVTEWDWGTTQTATKVFQLGYVTIDDTKVLVADVPRGSATPTIRPYYDITLPDDGSVKSLVIAGRAASGYVVKCVVVDITYTNEVATSLTSLLQGLASDIRIINNKIGDVEYQSVDVTSTTDWFPEGSSKGYYNVIDGVVSWVPSTNFCSTRIPIQEGYEAIEFIAFSVNWGSDVRPVYVFQDVNGNILDYMRYYDSSIGSNRKYMRRVVIPQGAAYLVCLYKAWGTSATYRCFQADEFEAYLENGENIKETLNNIERRLDTIDPQDTTHGVIGQMYPEEVRMIEGALNNRLTNRFHFIHLSDNHNTTFASASEFLDLCPADFLVNTGDLVADKFSDSVATTMAEATSPTKPVYLCVGNHDVRMAPSQQDIFDKYIAPTNSHNGTSFAKTYYHIDIDKGSNKFKCIFLNPYDGFTPEELSGGSMSNVIDGKMTSEQIVWFLQQLQDAATNGRNVCIFIHEVPAIYDGASIISEWCDKKQVNVNESTLANTNGNLSSTLLDIVDAFIEGTSYTYNDVPYNFSAVGKFVAWFAGHTHYDMVGRVNGHPNQLAVNVCRPNNANATADNSVSPLITWNYVTIDPAYRALTIYRVGQQQTVFGVKRDVVRVFY